MLLLNLISLLIRTVPFLKSVLDLKVIVHG